MRQKIVSDRLEMAIDEAHELQQRPAAFRLPITRGLGLKAINVLPTRRNMSHQERPILQVKTKITVFCLRVANCD